MSNNLEWEIQYAIMKHLEAKEELYPGSLFEIRGFGDGGYYRFKAVIDTREMAQDIARALDINSRQPIRNWLKICCWKIIAPIHKWSN